MVNFLTLNAFLNGFGHLSKNHSSVQLSLKFWGLQYHHCLGVPLSRSERLELLVHAVSLSSYSLRAKRKKHICGFVQPGEEKAKLEEM